jgi:HAD superfamily hydrolase (TIGR01509 family)
MLKALIFDFDGLIVDTEWPEYQAWQEVCQLYDVALTMEAWAPCIGTSSTVSQFSPYTYLVEHTRRAPEQAEVLAQVHQRHAELLPLQPVLPGVEALLQEAKQRGMGLAVASSSPRHWVAGNLSRLGLLDYFHHLTCGDEVTHVKPSPELYLRALSKLQLQADQAIALEDSLNGMLAARAAGLFCVVVPNRLTQLLPFGEVDLRLASLAELSLTELMASSPDGCRVE